MTSILAAGDSPLWHVVAIPITENMPYITNHLIMQILAGVLTALVITYMLRRRRSGDALGDMVPGRAQNAVEAICVALRDVVIRPSLGTHSDRFLPFLWTVFFYVLFQNLLGILPIATLTSMILPHEWFHGHGVGGAPTGNIWVTAALAIMTLFLIVYNGITHHGMGYVSHFFMGPPGINILIGVLEIIGVFFKAFALTVRLFANMIAGHILLAVLLSFVAMSAAALGSLGASPIMILVVISSVAINLLELFVAFLQAFIFTFLTSMFIGQALNIHHDHDHDEEHGAEHGHGHGQTHGAH